MNYNDFNILLDELAFPSLSVLVSLCPFLPLPFCCSEDGEWEFEELRIMFMSKRRIKTLFTLG